MNRVLVTGAAGFIGSNLARALIRKRYQVVGIDCFAPNYPRENKEFNVRDLKASRKFSLLEANLLDVALPEYLKSERFSFIYHQAATAGVRTSWGEEFNSSYVQNNIVATQNLLEAAVGLPALRRLVYASSSSVYGDARGKGELREDMRCEPLSPYGITKLAAEQLCLAYFTNFRVPTVALRYFSVYGPGHRPDMAAHIFTRAIFRGEPIIAHRGGHARDFTYVGDVVQANLLARYAPTGGIFNVGGGAVVTLKSMIETLETLIGKKADVRWIENPPGNVRVTKADLTKSRGMLHYEPKVGIKKGLAREIAYIKELYGFDLSSTSSSAIKTSRSL